MNSNPTISEMNEAIALFMEMKRVQNIDDPGFEWSWKPYPVHSNWCFYDPPPFDRSWNWLMPVIEKISKMPMLNADNTPCTEPQDVCYPRTFGMPTEDGLIMFWFNGFICHEAETLIEAAHAACYEVAEFENNKQKDNE
jgi:hypothetical protein